MKIWNAQRNKKEKEKLCWPNLTLDLLTRWHE